MKRQRIRGSNQTSKKSVQLKKTEDSSSFQIVELDKLMSVVNDIQDKLTELKARLTLASMRLQSEI
jgi:hypothetical protein